MTIPSHVEINYTEYGQRLYEWAMTHRVPISGGMEITHRCNLRCVHCYVASDKYPKELSTEQWYAIIDQIADAGCFWFYITGGEAMIRPDFLDIYMRCKRHGMQIAVLSNATCITDEIADRFAEFPPQCVEISMYGATEETFDRVGKVKNGYRRFMEGMEKLLVRNIKIKLKTIALRENYDEVLRIRRFADSLGISFRYDSVINARVDRNLSPHAHALTPQEVIALERHDLEKIKMFQHYCTDRLTPPPTDALYQCGAGRSTFNIDPYGKLSVCLLSRRPGYDVVQGNFREGWKVAIGEEISRKRVVPTKCGSCDMGVLCGNCVGYSDLQFGPKPVPYQQPVAQLCELAEKRVEAYGLKS